ncbi:MAG: hypothetical protein HOK97_03520, partial [Deltaproteobacteria bacterium]|nr:hypothetical protein [Deltaproteobacteria bacterium]
DVLAEARNGLMFDISQAIFEGGATIESARMTTEGRRAIHSFYIVEKDTGLVLSTSQQDQVQALIMERLS